MPTDYPLEWPSHVRRSTYKRVGPYRVSMAKARDDLYRELELFGATKALISSNARLRLDGKLAAQQGPVSDAGVAIYFTKDHEKYVIACDKWMHLQDNIRAVGLTIQAMRAIERHGTAGMVADALVGFKAIPATTGVVWWEALGLRPEATPGEIETAFRQRVKTLHPDVSPGREDEYQQLLEAYRLARLHPIQTTT